MNISAVFSCHWYCLYDRLGWDILCIYWSKKLLSYWQMIGKTSACFVLWYKQAVCNVRFNISLWSKSPIHCFLHPFFSAHYLDWAAVFRISEDNKSFRKESRLYTRQHESRLSYSLYCIHAVLTVLLCWCHFKYHLLISHIRFVVTTQNTSTSFMPIWSIDPVYCCSIKFTKQSTNCNIDYYHLHFRWWVFSVA